MIPPGGIAALLERTASFACQCLADSKGGTPARCYVYHSTPPDDCCDALIVWLDRLYLSHSFPIQHEGALAPDRARLVADVRIRLRRDCWPTVTDNRADPLPDPHAVQEATIALMNDAQRLYCCLRDDLLSQFSSVILPPPLSGEPVQLSSITPDRNLGGCAGWSTGFAVAVEECC